jgi:hypothetical protein
MPHVVGLAGSGGPVTAAQAHATLALAATTAMGSDLASGAEADGWHQAAGSTMAP